MEKTFKIKGMHCKSCEMLIKDELDELDSVIVKDISHKSGEVKLVFDSNIINESKIKSVIKNEGYEVQ
ncbi:cation transporter [Candidatus Woesearchaeota archaeon]|nr:cation transporter [Candidatus Woesearchaeota archaeon]MCF7900596.1 cation transporter [Candidatus Woesearchaeota archaeon]MCF8013412.1 cation transporter [Candidatus Woesearchaeota archaeon]